MNWIQSLLSGFISGLSEPMPLSAEAHRGLLRHFFGQGPEDPLFLLACHFAVLLVLLSVGRLELGSLHRAARLQRLPKRRRAAHTNRNQAGTLRLLRVAVIPAVLGRLLSIYFSTAADSLWILSITLLLSGTALWLPGLFRTANMDGRHLSAADGLLLGLGAMTAAVPGFSAVGAVLTISSIRGIQRSYAIRLAWILASASLAAAVGLDVLSLAGTGFRFGLPSVLSALAGGIAAAAGANIAVYTMRTLFRSAGNGFSGFCFYNWGMALLCLLLFLLV